jgi:hypothetical protein
MKLKQKIIEFLKDTILYLNLPHLRIIDYNTSDLD